MLWLRLVLVLGLVALLGAIALARRRRRAAGFEPRLGRLPDEAFPDARRAPLTAFYFTSRLCGACQDTPRIVRDAAPEVPAVPLPVHEHAGIVRALGVYETPTLLLVDEAGRIRYARVGNPEAAELWTYVREAWDSLEVEGALVRVTAAGARVSGGTVTGSARTP